MVASIKVSWTYGSHNRLTHILNLQFSKLRLPHSLSSIVKIVYLFRAAQVFFGEFHFVDIWHIYDTPSFYNINTHLLHSLYIQSYTQIKSQLILNQAKNIF